MNCPELKGFFELYALGLLDGPERSEIEEHLQRNCPNCTEELRRARALNSSFLGSLPLAAPSAKLRKRVLASVGKEESRGVLAWLPYAVALVPALLLGFFLTNQVRDRDAQLTSLEAQLQDREAANSRSQDRLRQLEAAIALISRPETRQVTFGKGPQGRVLVNPTRGVILLASNLPQVGPGKTYAFWVIPKGGAPRPAGLFLSDATGNALHVVEGPVNLATTAAVAVSVEPTGGSPAPTTTPIIVAPITE